MNEFNFGENLRMVRTLKDVKQGVLADVLNITQSTYSRMERRKAVPELDIVVKLSDALSVPTKMLLVNADLRKLIPQKSFEQQSRELIFTPLGRLIVIGLCVTTINAFYEFVDSWCADVQMADKPRRITRFLAGFSMFIYSLQTFYDSWGAWRKDEKIRKLLEEKDKTKV